MRPIGPSSRGSIVFQFFYRSFVRSFVRLVRLVRNESEIEEREREKKEKNIRSWRVKAEEKRNARTQEVDLKKKEKKITLESKEESI